VIVVKSERRLYLLQDGSVIRTYRVALGPNPVGHKVFQGDGRTPEGLYTLDWRNEASRFHRAIHISYPNDEDIERSIRFGGAPGGLIMIHGQPSDGFRGSNPHYDWTEGCVALSNAEMDEVWLAVDDGTPIEILP
jgi:murein L,D-transpeptidase YafK